MRHSRRASWSLEPRADHVGGSAPRAHVVAHPLVADRAHRSRRRLGRSAAVTHRLGMGHLHER